MVRGLRAAGHNVVALSEVASRSVDREVLDQAVREGRILITEDKDFGRLVFGGGLDSAGVILIRYPGNARGEMVDALTRLVNEQGPNLHGSFVSLQPGQVRLSRPWSR